MTAPPRRIPSRRRDAPTLHPRTPAATIGPDEAIPRALKVFGTVVAPTTLLTALLIYFGLLHVTGMFRYLGVNYTVLDMSVQDYLIRSADGLFVPLAAAAAVVLATVWMRGLAVRYLPAVARETARRRAAPVIVAVGLVLVGIPAAILVGAAAPDLPPEAPGLSLVCGTLLLAVGARSGRTTTASASIAVAEWAAVFVILSVGLFWAVGSYAIGVGTGRGEQIERDLAATPDIVLTSKDDLGLNVRGVTATACGDPDSPSSHRYSGLKLVIQSAGQLLFLPASWTHAGGGAIVMARTDEIRIEFLNPGTPLAPTC